MHVNPLMPLGGALGGTLPNPDLSAGAHIQRQVFGPRLAWSNPNAAEVTIQSRSFAGNATWHNYVFGVFSVLGQQVVGHTTPQTGIGVGVAITPTFQIVSTGPASSSGLFRYSNNGGGSRILFAKSRGTTLGSHAAVQAGDRLGELTYNGSDGSAFAEAVSIQALADGTISSGVVPGKVTIQTANSSGVMADRLTMDSAGVVTVPGTAVVTGTLAIGNTVNAVSPTAPDRTVTIVIGGTTYYLHAKTTND